MHDFKSVWSPPEDPVEEISNPDFSDFLWMAEEDLENFDSQVIAEVQQELQSGNVSAEYSNDVPHEVDNEEQEVFLNEMLAEEEARDTVFFEDEDSGKDENINEIHSRIGRLAVNDDSDAANAKVFLLNPHAPAFVPSDSATQ